MHVGRELNDAADICTSFHPLPHVHGFHCGDLFPGYAGLQTPILKTMVAVPQLRGGNSKWKQHKELLPLPNHQLQVLTLRLLSRKVSASAGCVHWVREEALGNPLLFLFLSKLHR